MRFLTPIRSLVAFTLFALLAACGGGGGGGAPASPGAAAIQASAGDWRVVRNDGLVFEMSVTSAGEVSLTSNSAFLDGFTGTLDFLEMESDLAVFGFNVVPLYGTIAILSQDPAKPVGLFIDSNGVVGMIERDGPLAANATFSLDDLKSTTLSSLIVRFADTGFGAGPDQSFVRFSPGIMSFSDTFHVNGGVQDTSGTPVFAWASASAGAPATLTSDQLGTWFGALEQSPLPLPAGLSVENAEMYGVVSSDKRWFAFLVRAHPSIETQSYQWYFGLGVKNAGNP